MTLDRTELIAITASCCAIVILILKVWVSPPFSPDGWAYYEMAQNSVTEIQSLDHQRTFVSEYPAVSFPPVWPLVWKVSDTLFRQGARSGLIAAGLAYLLLVLLSGAISVRVFGSRLPGTLAALLLLGHPGFRWEVLAAQSIPLAMCFFLAIVYLLFFSRRRGHNLLLLGIVGLLAGAAVMTRFDYISLLVVSGITVFAYRRSLTHLLAFSAGSLIVLSPWVMMSVVHFGVPFATDNGWVALSAEPMSYVNDWPPKAGMTVSSHPIEWALLSVRRAPRLAWSAASSPGTSGLVSLLLAIASIGGVSVAFRRRGRGDVRAAAKPSFSVKRLLAAAAFVTGFIALKTLTLLTTGYTDGRYFSEAYLVFVFVLLAAVLMMASRRCRASAAIWGMVAAAISVSAFFSSFAPGSRWPPFASMSIERPQLVDFPRLI